MANRTKQSNRSARQDDRPQPQPSAAASEVEAPARVLEIPAALTVGELSSLIGADPIGVIKQMMRTGLMLTINDVVEFETAATVAQAFGLQVRAPRQAERGPGSVVISTEDEDPDQLEPRPPVVTILGHVDHGKTTLLDAIRNTNVVAGEAGGITQHIGAYQVEHESSPITFLDTPGHEAFTAMRARGTQVTDVAVLVVAADDGIMPQTVEAIDHVKAAGVPLVTAINKVDRPDADQERVKRQLSEHDLLVEEWGGDVIAVPVSALTGEGVPDLLANILVASEISELKANPQRDAQGVVVEARIDKRKGPISTVLVQNGTLKIGDIVVVGSMRGRIKAMLDDKGNRIKQAGPSQPVELLGIEGVPDAGDELAVVANEKTARSLVESRSREKDSRSRAGVTLEEIHSRIESGDVKALNLVVKTDVQGSIDAMRGALEALGTDETRVELIHVASGSITENDVLLASASDAIIVGFNSTPEPGAVTLAAQEGVDIRRYEIIYQLIDDIERALKGLLTPVMRDVVEGYATVRATFNLGRRIRAAGIYVNDGTISRGAEIHVVRGGGTVTIAPMLSLKHFKDDVRELATGLEGGIVLDGFQDFQDGDVLEAHRSQQGE